MQGHTTENETETHSTMPLLSQIRPSPFLHPSTIAENTANTTSRKCWNFLLRMVVFQKCLESQNIQISA